MNNATNSLTKAYLNDLVFNRGVFQVQPTATFEQFKLAMSTIVIICDTNLDPVMYINAESAEAWIKTQSTHNLIAFNIESELLDENAFNECLANQ